MNYENINGYLSNRFPELQTQILRLEKHWNPEKVPSHVFYGDILNELLSDLLNKNTNKKLIKRIFDFYEELAECDDDEVRNLLQVTLLEYLWGDFKVLSIAHQYMGAKTRVLSDELQVYFIPFIKILNWTNPNCETTYGNTFTAYGSKLKRWEPKNKVDGKQYVQWLDDEKAAAFIAKVAQEKGEGTHEVLLSSNIPHRVILTNGKEYTGTHARIIVNPDGSVKTAYPFNRLFLNM